MFCMPAAPGVCSPCGDPILVVQLAGLVLDTHLAKAGGSALLHLGPRVSQRVKAALQLRVGGQLPRELSARCSRQVGGHIADCFRDAQPIIRLALL